MKPFDLEAAKAGKPVCFLDGRPARLICWDLKGNRPLGFAAMDGKAETLYQRCIDGTVRGTSDNTHPGTVMMATQKFTRWVNIYAGDCEEDILSTNRELFRTHEEAVKHGSKLRDYLDSVPVNWEA